MKGKKTRERNKECQKVQKWYTEWQGKRKGCVRHLPAIPHSTLKMYSCSAYDNEYQKSFNCIHTKKKYHKPCNFKLHTYLDYS